MQGKIVVALFATAFCGIVFTAPTTQNVESDTLARVIRFENNSNKTGKYSVIYELSNGIIHYETGGLVNDGQNQDIVEGSYWFVGPDNKTYEINYYNDDIGFHPLIGQGTGVQFKVLASSVG